MGGAFQLNTVIKNRENKEKEKSSGGFSALLLIRTEVIYIHQQKAGLDGVGWVVCSERGAICMRPASFPRTIGPVLRFANLYQDVGLECFPGKKGERERVFQASVCFHEHK